MLIFIRFHLYKENKNIQEALGVLGNMLGIQVHNHFVNQYVIVSLCLKGVCFPWRSDNYWYVTWLYLLIIDYNTWQERSFGFAVTKDKRAVTTQTVRPSFFF